MENKWPPDRVNTVSMPLARRRRAINWPACTVWVEGASRLISGAYRPASGTFADRDFWRRRSGASGARRRASGAEAAQAVHQLVGGLPRFRALDRQSVGDQ